MKRALYKIIYTPLRLILQKELAFHINMLQYSPRISWNSNEIKREGLLANNVLYYPDKFEIMHTTLFSISHIIVYN